MLSELLFVLSGGSSPLFSDGGLARLDFLHPGEAKLLSDLLPLGSYANNFQAFSDKCGLLVSLRNRLRDGDILSTPSDCYRTAFAEGVKDVLNEYRSILVRLESTFRNTPSSRNLLTVYSELKEYLLTFPYLQTAIDKISSRNDDDCNYRGCLALNLVDENLSLGIPSVDRFFEKIRRSCNRVFANQLIGWLKFGVVKDGRSEFFIQTFDNENLLRMDMCPKFLSANIREKIFFVGNKMSLIGNENKNLLSAIVDENCRQIQQILTTDEFDTLKLETPVENIRKSLSETLWLEIVANRNSNDDVNLFRCLNTIKDFYFLGKGELFSTLTDALDELSNRNKMDLDKILQTSFQKLYGVDKASLLRGGGEYFSMHFRKFDDQNASSLDRWEEYLTLNFNVSPLLKQIFTNESMEICSKIFRFLLKIRRVQAGLNKTWMHLLKNRRIRSKNFALESKIWRVDNLMLFLVNNLQYYLHVDVLDSAWKNLLTVLACKNVHEIQLASDAFGEFVRKVSVSCFMEESKDVGKVVDGLLNDCQKFVGLLPFSYNDDSDKSSSVAEDVQNVFIGYERHASFLFRILSNPKMHLTNSHLSQLLQRLDFNSYFSSTRLF